MFPFDVPTLTDLTSEQLTEFGATVRTFAAALVSDPDAEADVLTATRELLTSVSAEEFRRREASEQLATARADLAASLTPDPTTGPTPTPVTPPPAPVAPPAPVTPPPALTASTLDAPPPDATPRLVSMTAASDAPGAGIELADFRAAGALIERRLSTYSSSTVRNRSARRIGSNAFVLDGRRLTRHANVAFRREFPNDLRITDTQSALSVLDHAASERRLPGGGLRESTRQAVTQGRALTAAVGWCAPSETIYELCELETLDGILPLPEVQATRGGFFVPEDGGPNFATIYQGLGDGGDVILSEYEVENDTAKVCLEITCPDFVEVRLDVAYVCLTGSLLQRRGYPEVVTRFSQGAMVALAHKVNESVIARIVAASTGPTVIPTIVGSDDAASQLLSAIELAIEDTRYRNRMARNATIEVVLPAWVMVPIRAALSRRTGVAAINVTDAQILDAFTTRGTVPHFVYDWQDAFSGLVGGPGGAAPLTVLPTSVQFLTYPAGTWVKPVRDVVNLDTVYDNALLTQNQYTALFAEDGFNVLQMCPDSRLYQVEIDPAGIVGCCEVAS